MKTFASLFGGFGGTDIGAKAAGLEPTWSIELDAAVADVACANLGHRVYVRNILECDPMDFDAVDIFHASPPCTNASVANANGGETELDIALACKTAAFVTTLKPSVFTLENVWAYRNFTSWQIIEQALYGAGYWVSVEHVNAADHGVPQTRKRMIVRAIRGGFVPYLAEPRPWVGWYAAVADLIDDLPESQFAPWQLARLPELLATTLVGSGGFDGTIVKAEAERPAMTITANDNQLWGIRAFLLGEQRLQIRADSEPTFTIVAGGHQVPPKAFLMAGGGNTNLSNAYPGLGCRYADQPAHTVIPATGDGGAMPKAWLVDGANASRDLTIREVAEPSMTLTASDDRNPRRALLTSGRVVAMTPRALARFQSFPDSYELPPNARLAAKGIGNAVCPLLYQRIIEPLLEGL